MCLVPLFDNTNTDKSQLLLGSIKSTWMKENANVVVNNARTIANFLTNIAI